MLLYHLIFSSRQIFTHNTEDTMSTSVIHNRIKCKVLHATLQYTATHKPGVDKECSHVLLLTDDNTNQPIIAKLVGQGK